LWPPWICMKISPHISAVLNGRRMHSPVSLSFITTPRLKRRIWIWTATPLPEGGEWVKLQKLGTEGQRADLRETDANFGAKPYKLIQIAIPFGAGVRFRLNQVVDFSVELGFRYLFTDYIDDVSKNYVDLGVFGDNELAKAMSYRGNELTEYAGLLKAEPSSVEGHNRTYMLLPGYGKEKQENVRGNRSDKDTYMVTTFKLTYIFGKTFHRAKFR
jgi:hypothetical protein